eukprot:9497985-Pyramimonas_sp.AAC.1
MVSTASGPPERGDRSRCKSVHRVSQTTGHGKAGACRSFPPSLRTCHGLGLRSLSNCYLVRLLSSMYVFVFSPCYCQFQSWHSALPSVCFNRRMRMSLSADVSFSCLLFLCFPPLSYSMPFYTRECPVPHLHVVLAPTAHRIGSRRIR